MVHEDKIQTFDLKAANDHRNFNPPSNLFEKKLKVPKGILSVQLMRNMR